MGKEAPQTLGRCKLQRKLGEGAMGAVYLAEHTTLQIPVAVKLLPERMLKSSDQSAERFMQEARIAAKLHHPNIVRVYDCGQESGLYYLVMDYIQGETVADRLLREGRFDWEEGVRIVVSVAGGLHSAADKGVIHRDIKPDNIMLDTEDVPLITDLGVAKLADVTDSSETKDDAMLGTPFYMSPEQVRDARDADVRSDIYSLGASLYHMVCGEPPFQGGSIYEVMNKQLRDPVPSPREKVPEIPDTLCDVLAKTMAKSADHRYQDYAELIEDLGHVLAGEPVSAEGAERELQKEAVSEGETLEQLRGGEISGEEIPEPATAVAAQVLGMTGIILFVGGIVFSYRGVLNMQKYAGWGFGALALILTCVTIFRKIRPKSEKITEETADRSRERKLSLLSMLTEGLGFSTPDFYISTKESARSFCSALGRKCNIVLSEERLLKYEMTDMEVTTLLCQKLGEFYYGHALLMTVLDGPLRFFNFVMKPIDRLSIWAVDRVSRRGRKLSAMAITLCFVVFAAVLGVVLFFNTSFGFGVLFLLLAGFLARTTKRYSRYACDSFAAAVLADTEPIKSICAKEAMLEPQGLKTMLIRADVELPKEDDDEEMILETGEIIKFASFYSGKEWQAGTISRWEEFWTGHAKPALRINMVSDVEPEQAPTIPKVINDIVREWGRMLGGSSEAPATMIPEPDRTMPSVLLGGIGGILLSAGTFLLLLQEQQVYLAFALGIVLVSLTLGVVVGRAHREKESSPHDLVLSVLASFVGVTVPYVLFFGFLPGLMYSQAILQVPTVFILSGVLISAGIRLALSRPKKRVEEELEEEAEGEAAKSEEEWTIEGEEAGEAAGWFDELSLEEGEEEEEVGEEEFGSGEPDFGEKEGLEGPGAEEEMIDEGEKEEIEEEEIGEEEFDSEEPEFGEQEGLEGPGAEEEMIDEEEKEEIEEEEIGEEEFRSEEPEFGEQEGLEGPGAEEEMIDEEEKEEIEEEEVGEEEFGSEEAHFGEQEGLEGAGAEEEMVGEEEGEEIEEDEEVGGFEEEAEDGVEGQKVAATKDVKTEQDQGTESTSEEEHLARQEGMEEAESGEYGEAMSGTTEKGEWEGAETEETEGEEASVDYKAVDVEERGETEEQTPEDEVGVDEAAPGEEEWDIQGEEEETQEEAEQPGAGSEIQGGEHGEPEETENLPGRTGVRRGGSNRGKSEESEETGEARWEAGGTGTEGTPEDSEDQYGESEKAQRGYDFEGEGKLTQHQKTEQEAESGEGTGIEQGETEGRKWSEADEADYGEAQETETENTQAEQVRGDDGGGPETFRPREYGADQGDADMELEGEHAGVGDDESLVSEKLDDDFQSDDDEASSGQEDIAAEQEDSEEQDEGNEWEGML
ncbi:MAG: protein kinase domain-containing protein [Candidatus Brocadiia bacterium]